MTTEEARTSGVIDALVMQRNEWMDRWVQAQGEIAVLKKMLNDQPSNNE